MIADRVERPNVVVLVWIAFAVAMASPPSPEPTAPPPDVEALSRQALEGIATISVLQIELRAEHAPRIGRDVTKTADGTPGSIVFASL